jgi:hypothetical protein
MTPTLPRPRRRTLLRDFTPAVLAVVASLLALAVGWSLFSDRLLSRSERASAMNLDEARLWGGPLLQPHPSVRWRRADAATASLSSGELAQSHVKVDLDTQYRRRGLVEMPCYEALFTGDYAFKNPSSEPAFVAFAVGLPVKGESLMLRDLKLLVGAAPGALAEDQAHTNYSDPERIVWTGQLAGGATGHFQFSYQARGLERFGYARGGAMVCHGSGCTAEGAKPVTQFKLELNVRGARGALDRLPGWMAPTGENPGVDSTQLVWNVDRLLTVMDLGVVLPDNRGVSVAMAKLMANAPFFYLLFAVGLLYALRNVGSRARALHVLGLSGGYFLYYPLATYLTGYLPWAAACAVAFVGVTILAVLHVRQFLSGGEAAQVGLVQTFFLGAPAMAYLFPVHTGLILVISGFVVLGLALQAVGAMARRVVEEPERPALPVIFPAEGSVP